MSITVKSPSTGTTAEVNENQQLEVHASVFSESHSVAKKSGGTFLWTSSFSADTADKVVYIKNTSKSQILIINKATVNGVLTGLFELHTVTGTAAGTNITGANSNLTSGNTADVISMGDAAVTGLTNASRIDMARIQAAGRATMELQDVLILGQNNAIAITYTGSTAIVDIIVTGYFEDK